MTKALLMLTPWSLLMISSASGSNYEFFFQGPELTKPASLVIPAGSVLRSRLEEGVRIGEPGTPVSAVLIEPFYIGETLVVPQGTQVKGHIASVDTFPFSKRTRRLIGGDLTPPKVAHIAFDQLILSDGTTLQISTDATVGAQMRKALYSPNKTRPGIRQVFATAVEPIRAPRKLQRLGKAAVKTLPYHPEFLDPGTVFDATLLTELTASVPVQPSVAGSDYLHVRLLTPLSSSSNESAVKAIVFRPYYDAKGSLRFPAGTTLDGTISKATPSGRWKKHGTLLFEFHSASTPDGAVLPLSANVAGIQAAHRHSLSVGEEGDITARNSHVAQAFALASLSGPIVSAADPGTNKTAFDRAGQGASGFGLIGAGAAQASSATATSFGFVGAAMRIYDTFLAHGDEVELPRNTPVLLRIDSNP